MKDYQNEEFGLSFKYPFEWNISNLSANKNVAIFLSREPFKAYIGVEESLITIVGFYPSDEEYINDHIQRFYLDGCKVISESKLIVTKKVKKLVVEIKDEESNEELNAILYRFVLQEKSFFISIQYKSDFKDDLKVFNEIIRSIKFD